MRVYLLVSALVALAMSDMYLHNMRGSNNRLDEARRDRNNANRLFDSQNNNRGGSNVGSLYYYAGEKVPLEWTNQHGCGNEWNKCEIVIQYMCHETVRDGVTTSTIPDQPSNCLNNDCNTDVRYGMHENYDYWTNCRYRYRNRGLFTADQQVNGNTARYTRQNNNGQRRGYECAEERDHYPYWHPSPWIDVAIFTNNVTKCDFYKAESENVKGRHFCKLPDSWYHHKVSQGGNGRQGFIPNTQATCENLNDPDHAMVDFLLGDLSDTFEATEAAVSAELKQCEAFVGTCADVDETEQATCYSNLQQTGKLITQTDLNTQVPSCPDNMVLHPYDQCGVCISEACNNALELLSEDGECSEGLVVDTVNPMYCVPEDCERFTATLGERIKIDADRATALLNKHLVEYDSTDAPWCIKRQSLGVDCGIRELPKAEWVEAPSHAVQFPNSKIGAPECRTNPWSRHNHLGNGIGGFQNGFNWTVPPFIHEQCAMRVRYNITTGDYTGLDPHDPSQVNSALNRAGNNQPAKVEIRAAHDIPMTDSNRAWLNARGYYFEQNPDVQIFDFHVYIPYCTDPELVLPNDMTRCLTSATTTNTKQADHVYCPRSHPTLNPRHGARATLKCVNTETGEETNPSDNDGDFELQLAINTNQFGRTFQDRSHHFAIRPRDESLQERCNNIYALNVRGKRGNIVQTFPGTEYDFTPNRLHVAEGDCVHFQWTGSNTNPNNNDGQGKQGTDRSNIALLEDIRGEGGRGVEKGGGHGADGTTWTTLDMEPGLEGFVFDTVPTMGDVQCPRSAPFPHPDNFKSCLKFSPSTTGSACELKARPFQVDSEDASSKIWLDCEAGFEVDSSNPEKCINSQCPSPVSRITASDLISSESVTEKLRELLSDESSGVLSNMVMDLPTMDFLNQVGVPDALRRGRMGMSHPDYLTNVTRDGFLGLDYTQLDFLSTLSNIQFGGEMSELDDAGTYFDMAPHKVRGAGTYSYMCTRNNNFSNRSQKAVIVVSEGPGMTENTGAEGVTIGVVTEETMSNFIPSDAQSIMASSDYWMTIPERSLSSITPVGMSVIVSSNNAVGMDSAASDVVLISPPNLAASPVFIQTSMSGTGGRRADKCGALMGEFQIVDGDTLWYKISGDQLVTCFGELSAGEVAVLSFLSGDDVLAEVDLTLSGNNVIEGMWDSIAPSSLMAVESGAVWMRLTVGDEEYVGQPQKDPMSGRPIEVRLPVSPSMTYGKVYFWPSNEPLAEYCVMSGSTSTGCNQIRQEVDARIENGEARFSVGQSQTQPAGGYYQVSEGSNLALIVGLSVACAIFAIGIVGGAIYFRKHPGKWESVQGWGPTQYKRLKRSLASSV